VAINATGEWLAFGSAALGQLLVWEWRSESYVLKQQGHYYDINAVSYSGDGQLLATGGDDGKVKVWNTASGFCFVTFSEHSSGVNAVEFAKQGKVVFSASLDGTVRAFDLVRYRNFRTFTSPNPVQFTSLAVDPSGEIVCAGTLDTFEIFVWSVQTGKLLDILAGHTGPISSLAFSSTGMVLLSGSWDHSCRTWDIFGRNKSIEPLVHQTEVLAVAFRPDGKQIAAATLDGGIFFWDIEDAKITRTIEGRKDIMGGRKKDDRTSADNASSGKCFNSLCYTADGSSIIGSGTSKYICIYDVESAFLVKKFQISRNLALDGTQEMLNSKHMKEFGSLEEWEDEGSDREDRIDRSLPGTRTGDLSARKTRPEVKSKAVRFSPTGRAWTAATTDGLMIYSLDEDILFDPFDLEIDITPETVVETLGEKEYLKALCMAFRLNEKPLIHTVFEAIPSDSVELVCQNMPEKYLLKLLSFVGMHMEVSPHIEFHLLWVTSTMTAHGRYLRDHRGEFQPVFRALHKGVNRVRDDIATL
jgi:periodic tryptophan protein 2